MSGERTLSAIAKFVRELIAEARVPYSFLVRYRVHANVFGRVELQRVSKLRGYPDTLPLSFQPGAGGHKCTPALGAIVLVSFVEGDPTLPVVTHLARPDDGYFVPLASSLDASGTVRIGESATLTHLGNASEALTLPAADGRVVCYGDPVVVGSTSGVLTPGALPTVAKVQAR